MTLHREIPEPLVAKSKRIVVVGDLHGDAESAARVESLFVPESDILVFLGDYTDRGPDSLGCVKAILTLLSRYPERVFAIRGNHEEYSPDGEPDFAPCDLVEKVEASGQPWPAYFTDVYQPFVERLPLSVRLKGVALFVHAGVSGCITNPADLNSPDEDLRAIMLFSDSTDRFDGEQFNRIRGRGTRFGAGTTKQVCQTLGVERIFRGHQHGLGRRGPGLQHDNRLVTVITSAVYCRRPYVVSFKPGAVDSLTRICLRSGRETTVADSRL